jgi:hypothetical protein
MKETIEVKESDAALPITRNTSVREISPQKSLCTLHEAPEMGSITISVDL